MANGLRVLHIEDLTSPLVVMILWYHAGSRHEAPGKSGVAHLLEHMMFKGSKQYAPNFIDYFTDAAGGSNNAFTGMDTTGYIFSFASDRWREALAIEADRMRNCLFAPDEFRAEKNVVLEEMLMTQDIPQELLYEKVIAKAMRDHPYARPIIGLPHELAALTREDLIAFYDQYYRPDNALLVIAGATEAAEVRALVDQAFSLITVEGPAPSHQPYVFRRPQRAQSVTVRNDNQSRYLMLTYPAPGPSDPDRYPMIVLASILGGGKLSRLYQDLVEESHIAASVESLVIPSFEPFIVTLNIQLSEQADSDNALRIVESSISRLMLEGPDERELERVRSLVEANFMFNLERTEDKAQVLAEAELLGDYRLFYDIPKRIRAVTKQEITDVARRYLKNTTRVIGRLVPGKNRKVNIPFSDRAELASESQPAEPLSQAPLPPMAVLPIREPPLLNPESFILDNGLQVYYLVRGSLPLISVRLMLSAGAEYEASSEAGLALLTLSSLKEGTAAYSVQDLTWLVESMGGRFFLKVGYRDVTLALELTTAHFAQGLGLLASMVMNPSFDPDRVTRERELLVSKLKNEEEQTQVKAFQRFRAAIYRGHPQERPAEGFSHTMAALSPDSATQFFAHNYGPDRCKLVIVGDLGAIDVQQTITEHFGAWPIVGQKLPPPAQYFAGYQPCVELEKLDREQLHVYLGHPGIDCLHPDYPILVVLDQILGLSNGVSSRIPNKLRNELGLVYEVYASLTANAGRYPGCFEAYFATHPRNLALALSSLVQELTKVLEEGVTEQEVIAAGNAIISSHLINYESNADIAQLLTSNILFNRSPDYYQTYLRTLRAVTPQAIRQCAQRHLHPQDLSYVVAGPISHRELENILMRERLF